MERGSLRAVGEESLPVGEGHHGVLEGKHLLVLLGAEVNPDVIHLQTATGRAARSIINTIIVFVATGSQRSRARSQYIVTTIAIIRSSSSNSSNSSKSISRGGGGIETYSAHCQQQHQNTIF